MHVNIFLVYGLLLEHRQPIRGYTLENADSSISRSYTLLLIAFWPELGSLCPLTQYVLGFVWFELCTIALLYLEDTIS